MRRRRPIRPRDLPRILVRGVVQLAALFGGRYRRREGAHVLVRDAQGRILAVRTTYLGPGWMLPGGRVEAHETPDAAAVRETLEETGIETRVTRLLLVHPRGGDVSFVFAAEATGGELDPQLGEIAEAGWLGRREIRDTSRDLERLLAAIEAADGAVVYLGLPAPR